MGRNRDIQKKKKFRSIFVQLIMNIIVPVVIALFTLAIVNYYSTKGIYDANSVERNQSVKRVVETIMSNQDNQLNTISTDLNSDLLRISNEIVTSIDIENLDPYTLDLDSLKGVYSNSEYKPDLYIISKKDGVIINTTHKEDLNRNLYDFGAEFKSFLLGIYDRKVFQPELFSLEMTTKRLKKFTYQPTNDGEFIVELGVYQNKANQVLQRTIKDLNSYSQENASIKEVDLIFSKDDPFSLNGDIAFYSDRDLIINQFGSDEIIKRKTEAEGSNLSIYYIPIVRDNTTLYKDAIIRIVTDDKEYMHVQQMNLFKNGLVFILAILIVIALIYNKTRVITNPIEKLLQKVTLISGGDLNERADIEGNNEITKLSEQFNTMVEKLQEYYATLERKVEERTAEIRKQKDQIEEQKQDIESSIRYAKRIQNAILPPEKYLTDLFPDHFILYRPKDIVSGDFYWATSKNNKSYIAAVDCTGHGVPGAFMSIVGHDQLNYAINVMEKDAPGDILEELNRGVTHTLRQQKGVNTLRDGMDISLCAVDYNEKKLYFAGAKNNLYFIRDGVLQEIKADRHSIGGYIDEDLGTFTTQIIDLQEGDVFYIFSDGYADQFGGEKGKKFKYKSLKDLLLELQRLPMEEQREVLEERLVDWMGELEQIDDVLLIGVKI